MVDGEGVGKKICDPLTGAPSDPMRGALPDVPVIAAIT
jgi:hypothetical protein